LSELGVNLNSTESDIQTVEPGDGSTARLPWQRHPARYLLAALGLTFLLFTWLSVHVWQSYERFFAARAREFQLVAVSNDLRHADGELTRCARMAALTGDLDWEQRYAALTSLVPEAIESGVEVAPERRDQLAMVDRSQRKIGRLERQVFELVRQGQRGRAGEVVFGIDYEEEKRTYSAEVEEVVWRARSEAARTISEQHGRAYRAVALAIAVLVGLGGLWAYLYVAFARFERARIAALEAVRRSEARFRELHESMIDAFVSVDMDGRITDVNESYLKLVGYGATEIKGLSYARLIPERWHANEARIIAEQILPKGFSEIYEKEYRRKDGSVIPVELRRHLLRDDNGAPAGMWAIVRDISDRRRAQSELQESEERLRHLTASLGEAVWLRDAHTLEVLYVNEAYERIWGRTRESLVADPASFLSAVHPDDLPRLMEALPLQYGGRWIDMHFRILVRDGQERWIRYRTYPIFDREGRLWRTIGVTEDATEKRVAELALRRVNEQLEARVAERTSQLQHANRELESFAYTVSHDLKGPLRALTGFSQALMEDCGDRLDRLGLSYLERVRGAALRMGELIDDLLELSRVSRVEMTVERVDITAIARRVIEDLRAQEPSRNVVVRIDEGLKAQGDSRLLCIVLENLLSNAWKFTARSEHPRIEVLRHADESARRWILIKDNGVGFDMQYVERIFGPFQRLHTSDEFPGTGIGLATVARILQRHRGEIRAEAAPGQGATFKFRV